MFSWFINLFKKKEAEVIAEVKAVEAAVEKKVEAVAEAAKCGCGRSPTGFCIGLHNLTDDAWATHPDNPVKFVVNPATPAETLFTSEETAAVPVKKARVKVAKADAEPKAKKPRAKKAK